MTTFNLDMSNPNQIQEILRQSFIINKTKNKEINDQMRRIEREDIERSKIREQKKLYFSLMAQLTRQLSRTELTIEQKIVVFLYLSKYTHFIIKRLPIFAQEFLLDNVWNYRWNKLAKKVKPHVKKFVSLFNQHQNEFDLSIVPRP